MPKPLKKQFTHLHLHTEFSILDGTIRIPDLITKLTENNMTACAITDHGNMYATNKFYKAMHGAELKPIIGCEVYIAPRALDKKEFGIDNKYYHMTLLAKDFEGYKNLVKIVSIANIEGFYFKPRIDYEHLKKYSKGIVALSGCLSGVISKPLQQHNEDLAVKNLEKYAEIFKDNFYIEIQRNGIKEQDEVNIKLLEYANKYSLPIVATVDAHYLNKEDYEIQEVLWAISDGKTIDDPTRRKLSSKEFYVKTPDEMYELFEDLPKALENTQKITKEIEDYAINFDRIEPVYLSLPKEYKSTREYLRELVLKGAKKRYGKVTKQLLERIDYELEVIHDKGYDDYFLITKEFIDFCKKNDIMVGVRGSAAGSVVSYTLGITHIDPIAWELYFERFLNPERPSPPDIDIDIADNRRDEVIEFTRKKYGDKNVKQIGTFSKLQTRQAIRDVSRVLGIDLAIADKLSKMVVVQFGKAKSIDWMIENDKEFAEIVDSTPELKKMVSIVRKIAGMIRGVSTHACGIVITPKEVTEYAPIQKDSKDTGIGMTQFEMFDVEDVGMMKFDFLGLRNLAILGDTMKKIREDLGVRIDLQQIPTDDKETFKTIQSGKTVGVFQLEGGGMVRTIKKIKPNDVEEICYLLSAYRPGPMQFIDEYAAVKFGKKKPEYIIPELEPILSITNGVITYQEQVIRIAVDIAGYTMGHADKLRKAMGKKKMDIMEAEKPKFIEGAVSKGFDRKKIEQLWDQLVAFANYGFNKAHAASYAMISYWTAYFKTHYPLHYMASLLEGDLDNFDRVTTDLEDCNRMGIDIFPPDINRSDVGFTIEGENGIRFGLAAIKNVGEDVVKVIVDERKENGDFKHLDDFVYRLIDKKVQKRTIEYLIMSGAMDSFGDRNAMLSILPELVAKYKAFKKNEVLGQTDLFGATKENKIEQTSLPADIHTSNTEKLKWEKEFIGLYVSSHPLDALEEFFIEKGVIPIRTVQDMKVGSVVILGVIISTIKRVTTKKTNDTMAILKLEDKTGEISAVLFPQAYEENKEYLVANTPILVGGRVNQRDDEKSIIIQKLKPIDSNRFGSQFEGIVFKITEEHSEEDVQKLRDAIKNNPGEIPVKIIIEKDNEKKIIKLKQKVTNNAEIKKMQRLF